MKYLAGIVIIAFACTARLVVAQNVDTNAIDVDAFVKGQPDIELLRFVLVSQESRPVASKQVALYLAKTATRIELAEDAGSALRAPLLLAGEESDVPAVRAILKRLMRIYETAPFLYRASDENVERWYNLFHTYAILLADPSVYTDIARVMRAAPAGSEFALSLADLAEARALMLGPDAPDIPAIRALLTRARDRGIYGQFHLKKDDLNAMLNDLPGDVAQTRQGFSHLKPFYVRYTLELKSD